MENLFITNAIELLDEKAIIEIEGGLDPFGVVCGIAGIMSAAAYLYDFGYHYTKEKLNS